MNDISLNKLKKIYNSLQDSLSKEIFLDRLKFSIDDDKDLVMQNLIKDNQYVLPYLKRINKETSVVIFGAGVIGERIVRICSKTKIKCFIDNNKIGKTTSGFSIFDATKYIENDNSEDVYVITPIKNNIQIETQLINAGIGKNRIINIGEGFAEALRNQYFDLPDIEWKENEIFVDCGCFDGFTSNQLFNRLGNKLEKVYAFEPMEANIVECERVLKEMNCDYCIINKGCWDKEDDMFFYMAEHGMYVFSETTENNIIKSEVTTLDKELKNERVTMIKMDIEGAELRALKGAESIIKEQNPKLAICIYHLLDDFYTIPELILSYNPDYRLYIRHYGTNESETVLYALPL